MSNSPVEQVKDGVEKAAKEARPWIVRLARLGYATKGIVYLIVGGLAASAAFGAGGRTTGPQGAFSTILRQPYGSVMLGLVAVGLVGFALWRFVQAFLDPEHKGKDWKGLMTRGAMLASGVIHTSLAVAAAGMVLRYRGAGGSGAQSYTETVMSQPFGRVLVALAGLGVIAAGLVQFYRAYSGKFREHLLDGGADENTRTLINVAGRVGLVAHGLVLCLIGSFLSKAGLMYDAGQAGDLGDALKAIEQAPYGPWLLGIVSLGLIAYGLFELVQAKYRRIRAP